MQHHSPMTRGGRFVLGQHLQLVRAGEGSTPGRAGILRPECSVLESLAILSLQGLFSPTQGVFFANPGSPWMRSTNENTNGLLRQYLPKGTDLRVHDAAGLAAIETKLNTRPRKILGWKTSADVFGLAT